MDKDLYIELLENEIRRIRAGSDVVHSFVEYQKLNERYAQCEMDLQNREEEIKDLKLENDRLKRRNELMEDYIHAIACIKSKKSKFSGPCDNISCPYYDQDKAFGEGACTLGSRELIEQEADDLIEKLEEL